MIALSFDDGPNGDTTLEILSLLNRYHAKATFFMVGKHVKTDPHTARAVRDLGHEIGNHTFNHPNLTAMPIQDAITDARLGRLAIDAACNKYPFAFRAPFGNAPEGFNHVGWDIHGSDWAAESVESITEPIFAYLDEHKGGIVLLHDGFYKEFGADRSKTVEATRRILERYKDQKFVTVSELQNS